MAAAVQKITRSDVCRRCRQDLVRDCPAENERASPCLIATLHKFVLAAEGMGFTCDDLLEMLNGGMTVAEVLDLMILRATTAPKTC